MLRRAFPLSLVLLLLPIPVHATVWGDDPASASSDDRATMAICQKTKTMTLPAPDPVSKTDADCDSAALYYGIGRAADPGAARACAAQHFAHPGPDVSPLDGAGMLATVYANGKGAPRDLDLAIAYACRMDGASAEMAGRIAHLAKLKADGPGQKPFDPCDDATSGYLTTQCAARDSSAKDAARSAALAALSGSWNAQSRAALVKLSMAANAFADAVGENETDAGGTMRASTILGAEDERKDAFLALLKEMTAGTLKAAGTFAQSDKALNVTYGKVIRLKDTSALGSVDKDGIKTTQKAWLGYRDAFVAFAKAQAPAQADMLKVELTTRRTADLAAFLK